MFDLFESNIEQEIRLMESRWIRKQGEIFFSFPHRKSEEKTRPIGRGKNEKDKFTH